MNITITENILIEGQHVAAGEVISTDEETAQKLILMKRAEVAADVTTDIPADIPPAKGK